MNEMKKAVISVLGSDCKGIILYNWNRRYPADVKWDVDLAAEGFTQISKTDFVGHSH